MSLARVRQALADALIDGAGVSVRARPSKAVPKPGDGWVVVQRLTPADFTSCLATLAVVVVLSADEAKAEESLDTLGVALIDAVTSSTLNTADVSLEPQAVIVGQTASPLYAAVLTVSVLVESGTESS
jgi:hypothetical protein